MQLPPDEVKPGAPDWVVTFGDMMSLLLTFFVLLLSFSSMEASKFKVVAGYMREAFGLQKEFNYTGVPMGSTLLSTDARSQRPPAEELNLLQEIRRRMESAGMTRSGSVRITERGVAIRMDGAVLFASGQAELKPEAREMLDKIAELAQGRAGHIEIEGHTDDRPITSARYPSNWELASARAGAAARQLIDAGVPPSSVRAVGYADTRPIAPNDSAENRARNRRVEFVFVRRTDDADATRPATAASPAASPPVAPDDVTPVD